MGLLDDISGALGDMSPELRTGLLSAGLSMLATPGKFGQQVGRGGLAGLQGYQQAQAMAQQRQQMQTQQQMQALQLQQAQRDAARRQRLDELPGQFTRSPAQQALARGGGPTVANAQAMQTLQPEFDEAGYVQALRGIDPMAAISYQQATAKQGPAVKETTTIAGPDGAPVAVAVMTDGSIRPLGGAKPDVIEVNAGDRRILVDRNTGRPVQSFGVGASPDAVLSAGTTRRGQDLDVLQRAGEAQYITDPNTGMVTAVPKQAGAFAPSTVQTGAQAAGVKDAREALQLADQAESILRAGKATGSGIGSMVDTAAGWIGRDTEGAQAAAQLKAIGGMLTAKMPKMSGPQSDKDVQLYREMAGAVGDQMLPIGTRLAALETVREIQQRYAGPGQPVSTLTPPAAKLPTPMPGMVRNGYKLKPGGNPADPSSWEPVR